MKNQMIHNLIRTALLAASPALNAAVTTGGIAFVGFNADGNDDFAIVTLQDIASGESILFSENEWDGSAFSTGESVLEWTTPALTAGTVVTFSTLGSGSTASVSHGSLSFISGTATALAVSSEALYAFQGSAAAPSVFLAAIANQAAEFNGSTGTLANTGLSIGTTAVQLDNGTDGAAYAGMRSGVASFADYLPLIGDAANWQMEPSEGTLVLPFDTSGFTTAAIPEPSTAAVLASALAGMALLARRRARGRAHAART